MPDIKIIQAEYVVCPRTKKGEWMEKCMKCVYHKYRQVNGTVRCKYGEKYMFGGILDNDTTVIDIKKKCENCYYFYINGLFVCHKCVECKEQSNYKYYLGKEYDWNKPILLSEIYKEVKGMKHKKVYITEDNKRMIFERDKRQCELK